MSSRISLKQNAQTPGHWLSPAAHAAQKKVYGMGCSCSGVAGGTFHAAVVDWVTRNTVVPGSMTQIAPSCDKTLAVDQLPEKQFLAVSYFDPAATSKHDHQVGNVLH